MFIESHEWYVIINFPNKSLTFNLPFLFNNKQYLHQDNLCEPDFKIIQKETHCTIFILVQVLFIMHPPD